MQTDFLIIGQGIAGTCMAHALLQRGKTVQVIDLPAQNRSSVVAAGICNPITGKHFSLTWEAGKLFSTLVPFYESIGRVLGRQVFLPLPFYRNYHSIENQNQLSVRVASPDFAPFVEEPQGEPYKHWIDSPLGGWQTRQSGFVKVADLLKDYRAYLVAQDAFREARFTHEDLQVGKDKVIWQDIEAQKIIFCEGLQARQNPLFPDLAFTPNKGEWIKIRLQEPYTCPAILKQGVFFLPLGEGIYQVGATYDNTQTEPDNTPTEAGRQELLTQLREWLKVPFEVIDQQAGIRPATRTRRPSLQIHPTHPHIGLLNGLGSKGVSLAPFLALEMAEMILT